MQAIDIGRARGEYYRPTKPEQLAAIIRPLTIQPVLRGILDSLPDAKPSVGLKLPRKNPKLTHSGMVVCSKLVKFDDGCADSLSVIGMDDETEIVARADIDDNGYRRYIDFLNHPGNLAFRCFDGILELILLYAVYKERGEYPICKVHCDDPNDGETRLLDFAQDLTRSPVGEYVKPEVPVAADTKKIEVSAVRL